MSRPSPVARVGDYHVLDFIGAGGMGEVFRAVHSRSGQVAAVKFLTVGAELSPEARKRWRNRFIHEARIQERLRHPNLAAFYEWHDIGQTPCIVMEMVDGTTLSARIQGGAIPLAEAIASFTRIVEAVAFMHSQGIIHRDIKSSNVKINGRGEVKLLDFGIAKTSDMERLTATGAFVGTLQYMSPEQVKGKEADARCDIWALGALFYEMLSGSPPFEAPTWGELLEKVARAHYEPLSTRCTNLPREVDAIVRRCLQKQPAARYADASELLSALQQLGKRASGAKIAVPGSPAPIPYLPFFVAGGLGVLVLMIWLLWPSGSTTSPIGPTATPTSNPLVVTLPTQGLSNTPIPAQPTISPDSSDLKTITIDVFDGADQTQVFRGNQLLGHPPCQLSGHLGEQIDISLSRPGFQTRHESITLTQSRSNYSFGLDPS